MFKPTKQLLINAISGKGFNSMSEAIKLTEKGLAKFTGNQWNPDWEWNRSKLSELSADELYRIYNEKDSEVIRDVSQRNGEESCDETSVQDESS